MVINMPRPAAFLGGFFTAVGIFGVIIDIVQLTENYWWYLFFLAIGVLGGFSLGSVSTSFREQEKNAYLTLTGFMLAALILLTIFLIVWQRDNADINTTISGTWSILIASLSGFLTFIGTTMMSIGERI